MKLIYPRRSLLLLALFLASCAAAPLPVPIPVDRGAPTETAAPDEQTTVATVPAAASVTPFDTASPVAPTLTAAVASLPVAVAATAVAPSPSPRLAAPAPTSVALAVSPATPSSAAIQATPNAHLARVSASPPAPTAIPATPAPPSPTAAPKLDATLASSVDPSAHFSNVSRRTPSEVAAYLSGTLSDYPHSSVASVTDFSASDILETMDTVVLDQVESSEGSFALQKVYDTIARSVLTTLREGNGDGWVLVALDAGHGGNRAFYFDPGSNGTEARHTRAVVATMLRLANGPEYPRLILRTIFNDAIPDDFGLSRSVDKPTLDSILMRQARASMLAREAADWNSAHPSIPVAVHEISIHFNAGAGGAMVLDQGDSVRPEYVSRSLDFARRYLHRVVPNLNATGLLPAPLRLWGGSGLHDDVMMYRPDYINSAFLPAGLVLRYGVLQGKSYLMVYVAKALGIG